MMINKISLAHVKHLLRKVNYTDLLERDLLYKSFILEIMLLKYILLLQHSNSHLLYSFRILNNLIQVKNFIIINEVKVIVAIVYLKNH